MGKFRYINARCETLSVFYTIWFLFHHIHKSTFLFIIHLLFKIFLNLNIFYNIISLPQVLPDPLSLHSYTTLSSCSKQNKTKFQYHNKIVKTKNQNNSTPQNKKKTSNCNQIKHTKNCGLHYMLVNFCWT